MTCLDRAGAAILFSALALVTGACGDSRAAAIVIEEDPLLLNGPAFVRIPATIVSAEGRSLDRNFDVATSDADSVAAVENGGVKCLREGNARLRLGVGSLSASLIVECRPVIGFGPFEQVEFELGVPHAIPVVAYAPGMTRRSRLRYSARVADTTVAVVRNGLLVPLSLGQTTVKLNFGGIETEGPISVVVPVSVDTVQLAASEYFSWRLRSGRFRVSAELPGTTTAATDVRLRAVNANCAHDNLSEQTIYCVVSDSARVVAFASRNLLAVVRIVRLPN